jgi:hypothetical protein
MEDCEICGINIRDEHYEEYGRCQECYDTYTDCVQCGEHLEYYLIFNNCFDYDYCSSCFTDQRCDKYIKDKITCAKCSCCYECCDKICGKLKKDEVIKLSMLINLPDDVIYLIIKFL